jgi:hypothetical protein
MKGCESLKRAHQDQQAARIKKTDEDGNRQTIETSVGELLLELGLNRRVLLAGVNLGLNSLAALLVGRLLQELLRCLFAAQGEGIVVLVPASERRGIDLHNGTLDERLGADELVVRGIVDNCAR